MVISLITLSIFVWAYAGCIYREQLHLKAIQARTENYNQLIEVVMEEFGEYKVRKLVQEHSLQISMSETVTREAWAVKIGW